MDEINNKKKKNKKKKGNNQNKAADDVPAVTVEEIGGASADVQSVGVSESDVELEKHKTHEENNVKVLEEVRQLESEKNQWLQKEAIMEERIKLLQDDIHVCMGKEARLEEKLRDLQIRTDSSLLKEATLEDRVKYIEGLQDSWTLKENLIIETIARLDEVNIRLQDQVEELKEFKDNLVEENIQLKQSTAVMESRIQHLETEASFSKSSALKIIELPEKHDPEHQLEAAHIPEEPAPENTKLVGKLPKKSDPEHQLEEAHTPEEPAPENTNLVGKVNVAEHSTTDHTTAPLSASPVDYASEYSAEMYESGHMVQTLARAQNTYGIPNNVEEDLGTLNGERGRLLGIHNSRISEDVVSVPLDDIQVLETESQVVKNEESPVLPLSDAPLIGAPFRLFSFVAKYVSGADLVDQERSRYG